ncbi:GH25 family lysozyme [Sphingomonas kyeonggiensis]|uniref:Lysozyme n=1 Tax=Sphingomonas kyeonggiensis TaxID=1268553 RepID=A0A7W6JTI7_9SPHN|nr:GH25 family lysozyme [Sphingomonas kyeonggiensis]MBB4098165.1 lysozyme [Sphingomonas kyeonggiensis]
MHIRVLVRRLRFVVPALLLLALLGWSAWLFASRWRPTPSDFPVQGVDVSEEQGPIEWWTAKKAGIDFAYIRATTGSQARDLRFPENWRWTFEAGIRRGALHVYSLCQLATDQSGNFMTTVPRSDDQLPPAVQIDFQPDCPARPERQVVIGEIGRFLHDVETHIGKPAILMVSSRFEDQYRLSDAFPRLLWAQQRFFPPSYFARPWSIWQASRHRRIEGVGAPVNWDVMAK